MPQTSKETTQVDACQTLLSISIHATSKYCPSIGPKHTKIGCHRCYLPTRLLHPTFLFNFLEFSNLQRLFPPRSQLDTVE